MKLINSFSTFVNSLNEINYVSIQKEYPHGYLVNCHERVTNIFDANYCITTSEKDVEKYVNILEEAGYTAQNGPKPGYGGKYYLHIKHPIKRFNFGWI